MTVTTRPIAPADRAAWEGLFAGYAAFYKVDQTPQMRDIVFGWLMDDTHSSNCIVAEDATGTLIGFTHFRPFVSQLRASTNCFLDDLFVDPASRGSGAAQALIGAVKTVAQDKGWGTVRWITAEDNYRGRGVYDKLATRTPWVTYDIKL
jgi:GNAT superfamily N-acetyltransferase